MPGEKGQVAELQEEGDGAGDDGEARGELDDEFFLEDEGDMFMREAQDVWIHGSQTTHGLSVVENELKQNKDTFRLLSPAISICIVASILLWGH